MRQRNRVKRKIYIEWVRMKVFTQITQFLNRIQGIKKTRFLLSLLVIARGIWKFHRKPGQEFLMASITHWSNLQWPNWETVFFVSREAAKRISLFSVPDFTPPPSLWPGYLKNNFLGAFPWPNSQIFYFIPTILCILFILVLNLW